MYNIISNTPWINIKQQTCSDADQPGCSRDIETSTDLTSDNSVNVVKECQISSIWLWIMFNDVSGTGQRQKMVLSSCN